MFGRLQFPQRVLPQAHAGDGSITEVENLILRGYRRPMSLSEARREEGKKADPNPSSPPSLHKPRSGAYIKNPGDGLTLPCMEPSPW